MYEQLTKQFELYSSFNNTTNWTRKDGDALLFECLRGCIKGQHPLIESAFDGELWYRQPQQYKVSSRPIWSQIEDLLWHWLRGGYTLDQSIHLTWNRQSTISRDMLLGLAWWAYFNNRLDVSEQVIEHALRNLGVMGNGDPTKTIISPALLSTFAWVSYRLGGLSRPWLRLFKPSSKVQVGYQAHLQVLHHGLRSIMDAPHDKSIFFKQYKRNSHNALFAFFDCRYDKAISTLYDTRWFPTDRLPAKADRFESWLWQRDFGSDWFPDTETYETYENHNGADFMFAYALLFNKLKKPIKIR